MRNFFYYFYYRIKETHPNSGPNSNHAERSAFLSIVLLLLVNCLSLYFLFIQLFPSHFTQQLWSGSKTWNRLATVLLTFPIPVIVFYWYKKHTLEIANALTDFKRENQDERRTGGLLIMAYIFGSCSLLILAMFLPLFV